MRVLMFTWEFPPFITGGLGMACYGMVKSLLKMNVEIDLVLPTEKLVYFPLRSVEDIDIMPVAFLDKKAKQEYEKFNLQTLEERLEYIGVSETPESYITLNNSEKIGFTVPFKVVHEHEFVIESKRADYEEEELLINLSGDENIFQKVQEFMFRANRYATELDFDLIHAHDWLTYPAGMIAKAISGKKLVSHIHATEFDRSGGTGDDRIHKIEYSGMTYADQVIAVSRYTAEMIISRYRIDTGKIGIVHNAYIMDSETNCVKDRLFSGPTILFLGRITLQKGPDYFINVAKRVLEDYPDARFIMAGTGDMARSMIHLSAKMRLKHRFLFTGFLNRHEVDSILRATDIYIMPSVSEPFGIAPLEAMAYGVTALISKQSGVAEVVENAYKVDFWNIDEMVEKISYLIENPVECVEMGYSGMLEVRQIQWDEAAEKIRQIYNDQLELDGGR